MKRSLAALLLVATACGDDAPTGAQTTIYAALCAARGVPELPSISPRQHLRAIGFVEFGAAEQGIRQRAEVWLGGPARMRFKASAENGARNVFLVTSPGVGWLSPANNERKWEAFQSPEVERETLLRWEVLRFPWGWQEIVEEAGPDARSWTRRAEEGEIVITVGDELLATSASYAGVELTLEAWQPADDAPWLIARTWGWNGPSGQRSEHYDELSARWMLFDDWFRPPTSEGLPDRSFRAVGSADAFGVVQATLWRLDSAPEARDQSGAQWWLRDGERFAAVLLPLDAPPPPSAGRTAPISDAQRHWLRWTFVSDAEGARAAASEISGIARSAGMEVLGTPLLSEPDLSVNSVTILLPVTPKDS